MSCESSFYTFNLSYLINVIKIFFSVFWFLCISDKVEIVILFFLCQFSISSKVNYIFSLLLYVLVLILYISFTSSPSILKRENLNIFSYFQFFFFLKKIFWLHLIFPTCHTSQKEYRMSSYIPTFSLLLWKQ